MSVNWLFFPACPVEVTFWYLGARTPSLKLVSELMSTDWPTVKKCPARESPAGKSETTSGRRRSPHHPPPSPSAPALIPAPTAAFAKKVVPPYDCVLSPSCGTEKMISGEVWLSAKKMWRYWSSSWYAPEAITAS